MFQLEYEKLKLKSGSWKAEKFLSDLDILQLEVFIVNFSSFPDSSDHHGAITVLKYQQHVRM